MICKPLVTVVIPTYNHAHFLGEALRSLRAQTYDNWEAVVVNNFSEDETIAVVEAFGDSRIRLENFHNQGIIAASRNKGIELARGTHIAFLDSDDSWYPKKLMACMELFSKNVGVVCHGLRWIGEQEKDVFCGPESLATYDALLNEGCSLTTSATVVRKDLVILVGGFSESPSIVTAEDYHFWLKLAQAGVEMRFTQQILGQYRVHSGNQSGSAIRHLKAVMCVVDQFFPASNSRDLRTRIRVRRRYGLAYYGAARHMQRSGQLSASFNLLFKSLTYFPFLIKTYIALGIVFFATFARSWRR